MKTALAILADHWLAFAFIGTGLVVCLVALLFRRRLAHRFLATALVGAAFVLTGLGGVALPALQAAYPIYLSWGLWIGVAAAVVLFALVLLVLLTGVWSNWGSSGRRRRRPARPRRLGARRDRRPPSPRVSGR